LRKGISEGIVTFLTGALWISSCEKDLLLAARAVGAQFGAHLLRGKLLPKAKTAAARALEIDNRLGGAHVSLGYVSYMYDWDWPAAGKHFEQALTVNPAYSKAHTSYPF
jgi:tetratricopeptide (TPR) repeat protein